MNTQTDLKSHPLFDVVIYEIATRKVDTITGKDLRMRKGHYNAERRLETTEGRLNDRYDAEIVPAGKFKAGDILPKDISDITNDMDTDE